jgi:hypothetical protein
LRLKKVDLWQLQETVNPSCSSICQGRIVSEVALPVKQYRPHPGPNRSFDILSPAVTNVNNCGWLK